MPIPTDGTGSVVSRCSGNEFRDWTWIILQKTGDMSLGNQCVGDMSLSIQCVSPFVWGPRIT